MVRSMALAGMTTAAEEMLLVVITVAGTMVGVPMKMVRVFGALKSQLAAGEYSFLLKYVVNKLFFQAYHSHHFFFFDRWKPKDLPIYDV